MNSLAFLLVLSGSLSVCFSQQTDRRFLQNVLSTGPLSTGSADDERDSSLESYLQNQYSDFTQQIVVGASPASAEKFDLMQIIVLREQASTSQGKLLHFLLANPAPADPKNIFAAFLRIHLTPKSSNNLEPLEVYQVVQGQPLNSTGSHRLVSVQFINAQSGSEGQWISFNILPAVMDWLQGQKPNLGLLIVGLHQFRVENLLHRPTISIKYQPINKGPDHVPRFEVLGPQNEILIQTDEILMAVPKNKTTCKREQLRVNFRQWGLLEPSDQDIGYCSGTCGKSELSPGAAEHTAIIALLSERDQNLLGPQCSASKYEPVAVMFKLESGNFVIKKIPRLAVRKCECH